MTDLYAGRILRPEQVAGEVAGYPLSPLRSSCQGKSWSQSHTKASRNVRTIRGIDIFCSPKHMTLHKSVLESILAVCHESTDGNPGEVLGRDGHVNMCTANKIPRPGVGKDQLYRAGA